MTWRIRNQNKTTKLPKAPKADEPHILNQESKYLSDGRKVVLYDNGSKKRNRIIIISTKGIYIRFALTQILG